MEKYINDHGKECYRGVKESTKMSELEFHEVPDTSPYSDDYDRNFRAHVLA